jgi:predicted transcriptional regulator
MTKKTFNEIRENILKLLKTKKRLTATQISQILNADYRTIKRHVIWLKGLEKINSKKEGRKTYYFLNMK